MNEAAAKRRYDKLHEDRPYHDGTFSRWSAEATSATPFHYLDGVDIFVAEFDVNPADDFLAAPAVSFATATASRSVPLGGLDADLDGLGDDAEHEGEAADDEEERTDVGVGG